MVGWTVKMIISWSRIINVDKGSCTSNFPWNCFYSFNLGTAFHLFFSFSPTFLCVTFPISLKAYTALVLRRVGSDGVKIIGRKTGNSSGQPAFPIVFITKIFSSMVVAAFKISLISCNKKSVFEMMILICQF